MSTEFQYVVFLKPNSQDKPRVWRPAEQRENNCGFRIADFGFPPPGVQFTFVHRSSNFALSHADRRFVPLRLADGKLPDTLRRVKREAVRWTRDLLLPHLLSGQVNLETD